MPATTGSATGSTKGPTSLGSTPRYGRMQRRRTWSILRCSATATTRTPPASATSPMSGLNGGEARTDNDGRSAKKGQENGDENGSADHRLVFGGDGPLHRWF